MKRGKTNTETNIPKDKKSKYVRPKKGDKAYTIAQLKKVLPRKQVRFCHFYIRQYNGTQSYRSAYGEHIKPNRAGVEAYKLLRKPQIAQYITLIERDIAKEVGISKIDFLTDLKHIAKAELPDVLTDWVTRKELSELKTNRPELMKCLQETDTKIVNKTDFITKEPYTEEYVKIKLKDGLKATDMIFKAMNWYAPEEINIKQETKVSVDITQYDAEEKALLLRMARKDTFKED